MEITIVKYSEYLLVDKETGKQTLTSVNLSVKRCRRKKKKKDIGKTQVY